MLGKYAHRLASSTQCRLTSTYARTLRGEDLGSIRHDAHQTFRARRVKEEKALPLPPLLDPVILEKRSRWQKNKAQPEDVELTPFQKKLQMNPYGMGTTCRVGSTTDLCQLMP
jgi:hypothetical protein